jgi:hypothetical protein
MHARFSGLSNIITALGYGHMNASFTYAICSEERVRAALVHFAKNAANLRIAQDYQVNILEVRSLEIVPHTRWAA